MFSHFTFPKIGQDAQWIGWCNHCEDSELQVSRGGIRGVQHCYRCGSEKPISGFKQDDIGHLIMTSRIHWSKHSRLPYEWHTLTEAEKLAFDSRILGYPVTHLIWPIIFIVIIWGILITVARGDTRPFVTVKKDREWVSLKPGVWERRGLQVIWDAHPKGFKPSWQVRFRNQLGTRYLRLDEALDVGDMWIKNADLRKKNHCCCDPEDKIIDACYCSPYRSSCECKDGIITIPPNEHRNLMPNEFP
jgi:hypothetical protein